MKYRSVLFVPGHEEKKIKKAYTLDADLVVIDLESTVPDNEKQNARKIIKNCNVDKKKTYIRINNNKDLVKDNNSKVTKIEIEGETIDLRQGSKKQFNESPSETSATNVALVNPVDNNNRYMSESPEVLGFNDSIFT